MFFSLFFVIHYYQVNYSNEAIENTDITTYIVISLLINNSFFFTIIKKTKDQWPSIRSGFIFNCQLFLQKNIIFHLFYKIHLNIIEINNLIVSIFLNYSVKISLNFQQQAIFLINHLKVSALFTQK